ncbi:unnamed protein product [Cochlearia groenlandica]
MQEHKYPSEAMKTKIADEIGLTEKQVSSWLCHRRTKDRNFPKDEANNNNMASLDRSSAVVHDGGVHRQDSSDSTKQTYHMDTKTREVESQRLYKGSYNMENVDDVADSSSSESSSSLHSNHLVDDETCRYVSRDSVATPLHPECVGGYGHKKPSGYLKVKGQSEKAVITCLKRQLGRHNKEEGPHLGVHFDPLPPYAFESPNKEFVQVGNQRHSHSPYVIRNSMPWSGYRSPDSMDKVLLQAEKYFEERDYLKMHREKLHVPISKPTVAKRLKHGYVLEDQIKGCGVEVPLSSSEDGTAETSSSSMD